MTLFEDFETTIYTLAIKWTATGELCFPTKWLSENTRTRIWTGFLYFSQFVITVGLITPPQVSCKCET